MKKNIEKTNHLSGFVEAKLRRAVKIEVEDDTYSEINKISFQQNFKQLMNHFVKAEIADPGDLQLSLKESH